MRAGGGLGGYEACMITVQRVIDAASVDQCEEVPTRKIAGGMLFTPRYIGLRDELLQHSPTSTTALSTLG